MENESVPEDIAFLTILHSMTDEELKHTAHHLEEAIKEAQDVLYGVNLELGSRSHGE